MEQTRVAKISDPGIRRCNFNGPVVADRHGFSIRSTKKESSTEAAADSLADNSG